MNTMCTNPTYAHMYTKTSAYRGSLNMQTLQSERNRKKMKYKERALWVILKAYSEATSFFQTLYCADVSCIMFFSEATAYQT